MPPVRCEKPEGVREKLWSGPHRRDPHDTCAARGQHTVELARSAGCSAGLIDLGQRRLRRRRIDDSGAVARSLFAQNHRACWFASPRSIVAGEPAWELELILDLGSFALRR